MVRRIEKPTITNQDSFCDIARHYDLIMDHVDYGRWFMVVTQIAALLPNGFRHLDAACGTGTLLKMIRRLGWNSFGTDLSFAMLRTGKKGAHAAPAAVADLRAMPSRESLDYITCLFDSMNFLLEPADFRRALDEFYGALTPNGILYFDVVTERMVFDHYEDQTWVEDNGRFSTTWDNHYDRRTGVIITEIRVNTGASCRLYERIYPQAEIERALAKAGFNLLGVYDAHSWSSTNHKTVRIDFIAAKGNSKPFRKPLRAIRAKLRQRLR